MSVSCLNDTVLVAGIGTIGAIIGSIATVVASIASHWWQEHINSAREEPRRQMLQVMLNHSEYQWRSLETLMHVIGADEALTKRLLLEIGARASEDGKQLWGLVSRNPLP